MKICLILQRNFAYIGHSIAMTIKEKYGESEFCGYVSLRSSHDFLKKQPDVHYTSLLLDEEIHERFRGASLDLNYLNKLENEYGYPTLWPYLISDRVVISGQLLREYPHDTPQYSHEDMLKIIQVKSLAISKFLDEEKPNALIYSVVAGVGNTLLYQMAKKRGIKMLGIVPTTIKKRYTISPSHNFFFEVKKNIVSKELLNEAKDFLEQFRKNPLPYNANFSPEKQNINRAGQLKFLMPKNLVRSFFAINSEFKKYICVKNNDYSSVKPWFFLFDRIKRKLRNLRGQNDLYDKFNPNENFVFYPLQVEPEMSLSVQAPSYFSDQQYLIKQIAMSLPVGFKLYVKEHPQMAEYRPRAFYKKIKGIPNVKLINPSIKSFDIFPYAKLITTINGTSGWEASMLKKPAITFGSTFYNQLSFVKNCKSIADLPLMIKEQLENFKYSEEELVNFIANIISDSVDVDLPKLWDVESDMDKKRLGLRPLVNLIISKILPPVTKSSPLSYNVT
ncbi:MAG: hypothetical protein HY226_03110 [Candidatus Vogelbacteria bacterium]|nr:hypothetical protein [Candidatus Vogelbacteria bacterium]